LESEEVVTEEGAEGYIQFRDGMRGAGQPVQNVATVDGGSVSFCAEDLFVDIVPVQIGASIVGDANGDARNDIADPSWIINERCRDGEPSRCREASDANADGLLDLSDGTYLIQYLFFAGSAPVGSLECAINPNSTVESCPAG